MNKPEQPQLRIGVALDIFSIVQSYLIGGIQDYIHKEQKAWRIQVADVKHLTDSRTPTPSFDGAISVPPDNVLFHQKEFPVVLVRGDTSLMNLKLSTIEISHRQIMKTAVSHYLSKGFKHIGLASYPHTSLGGWIDTREESFTSHCQENNIARSIFSPTTQLEKNPQRLLHALEEWLQKAEKPFAVIAINDVRAMDVLRCCRNSGLQVPGDIALMGIDNNPTICPFMDPPLSSIALNYRGIGFEAAALLDEQLNSPSNIPPRTQKFDSFPLMERASSDVLVPQNPLIEKALQFIRNHCHEPIQSEEICTALNVSSTTLNRRFNAAMNGSLHENLQQERMRKAKKMLSNPKYRLKEIANACGFPNPQYFSTVFRKREQMTPGQYREYHRNDRKFMEGPSL